MTAKEDRKPGRPRDDTVDEAIIDATLELLAEVGMAGLSIEGIVARAGVSKAALYRRWDSKETLVIDAVVAKVERTSFEESGEIRKDLLAILQIFGHFVSGTKAGSVFPWVMGEVSQGTELGDRYAREVILPRRRMISRVIEGGIERGELKPDLDVTAAVDMFLGPVIIRKVMGDHHESTSGWGEHLVDTLLDGWRAG
jgi:AcrR family transcriptional regulator